MESISYLVKVSLPKYLQSLPIPDTVHGFVQLSVRDIFSLVIFLTILLTTILAISKLLVSSLKRKKVPMINHKVRKENPKVVDQLEIEDLFTEKIAYCRCWKSEKFPLCDGSHSRHNEASKDNIGPLVLTRKDKE